MIAMKVGTLVTETVQAVALQNGDGVWHFACGAMLTGSQETQTMIEVAMPTQRPSK